MRARVVVVRRVVPHAGEPARRAVVDDPAADEHDPVDDVLDGAELVRDVEDRDAELRRAAPRGGGRATPARRRRHRSSARRARAASARRRAPSRSARAAASRPRASAAGRRPGRRARPSRSRASTASRSDARSGPQMPGRREAAGRDDLAHRHRRLAERAATAAAGSRCGRRGALAGRLPNTRTVPDVGPLEPEHEPQQRRLAAAVRAGDRDELARARPRARRPRARARPPGSRTRRRRARRRRLSSCIRAPSAGRRGSRA